MKKYAALYKVFESSVILEGSKTSTSGIIVSAVFESSVILEGSKTDGDTISRSACLRVVLF